MRTTALLLALLLSTACGNRVVVGLMEEEKEITPPGTPETDSGSGGDSDVDSDTDTEEEEACEWKALYDTPAPMMAVWGWGEPNTTVYAGGGDTPNDGNGILYHFQIRTGKWVSDQAWNTAGIAVHPINGIWGSRNSRDKSAVLSYKLFFAHDKGLVSASVTKTKPDGAEWVLDIDTDAFFDPLGAGLLAAPLMSVWGMSDLDVYAVGGLSPAEGPAQTKAVQFDGESWVEMPVGLSMQFSRIVLNDVWGSADDDIYAVTGAGHIVHYDGEKWTTVFFGSQAGSAYSFQSIWGRGAKDVYAVGAVPSYFGPLSGIVMRWDGEEWTRVDFGGLLDRTSVNGIWGVEDREDLYIVGARDNRGVMYRYHDGEWVEVPYWSGNADESYQYRLNDIWGDKNGNLFVVSDRGIYSCLVNRRFPI